MARCLVLTVLIELGTAAALGVRRGRDFANISLVNLLTNPVVVVTSFLVNFFTFGMAKYIVCIVLLEIAAFFTEALIYKKTLYFNRLNPFILSLILNAASYLSGLVVNRLF